ncbi:hypothetical protein C8J56DRAFT_785567, partial [Mycena floridula]
MIKAYGNVHILHNANPNSRTTETEAWIAFRGSSARRPAKIATYWGDNSKNNNSLIIEDVCAYNRASLIAILICLGTKKGPLAIYTSCDYAVRSVVEWGPKNFTMGWRCANGDILQKIAYELRSRPSAVSL